MGCVVLGLAGPAGMLRSGRGPFAIDGLRLVVLLLFPHCGHCGIAAGRAFAHIAINALCSGIEGSARAFAIRVGH